MALRKDIPLLILGPEQVRVADLQCFAVGFGSYMLAEVEGRKPCQVLQGPQAYAQTVAYMRDCMAHGQGFSTEVLNYTARG
ncbi:MAG: hypothetical protein WCJ35_18240 [Planctomycetota bacterium]